MRSTAGMLNGFDPTTLDTLAPRDKALVERRAAALGPSYRLFYDAPLNIVRAQGVHLFDADGRSYLDAYNNVPSVGHCHSHVVQAIAAQAAVLNTHTRYLDEGLLSYSERLLALFPAALDRVMYTCTGSEAVDLALRMARHMTGGTGIIITDNAYHGTTIATSEISPSLGRTVPLGAHVVTVAAPDPKIVAGGDLAAAFADRVAQAVAQLQRHGLRPAAFIADSIFSSDGVFADPAGFLRPAIDVIHAAGALYIADEVQPGFGRTGRDFWGFQRHGVAPDLVVMGKPMGNGMPIAAVVARAEVAEAFGNTIRYFNTFGANHVSIAAANAVLDVLQGEQLMQNAADVGDMLLDALNDMATTCPRIAQVRGAGLFVGVELRGDARMSADVFAGRLVNQMRQRGVLISTAGPRGDTLKIRPPLCFSRADAARLLEVLAETIADLDTP